MAVIVQSLGACLVRIDAGSGLETLGYTDNGTELEHQPFYEDVPGDENGGDAGPPIDISYFGQISLIRGTLTKFDQAVIQKLEAFLSGATAGTPGTPGTLMFADSKTIRVLLQTTSEPRNFTRCVVRRLQSVRGSRATRYVFEFAAYKNDSGVLWNEVAS